MKWLLFILLLGAATVRGAEVEVELAAQWIELPTASPQAREVTFAEPHEAFAVNASEGAVSKSFSQPVSYEFRPVEVEWVSVRYTGEMRVENVWGDSYLQGNLGCSNRVAFDLDVTRMVSNELALETVNRFVDRGTSTINRAEWRTKGKTPVGLTYGVTGGVAAQTDAAGAMRNTRYARLELAQELPFAPVRLRVAPSFSTQDTATSGQSLAGVDASITIRAAAQTRVSVGAAETETYDTDDFDSTTYRAVYAQAEQKLLPDAALKLRASYEDRGAASPESGRMYVGMESTFALTDSILGAFRLRHGLGTMITGAQNLSETLLSFSLGGGF
ncbi:MAG: hypothetical protein BGO12_17710 [Verrucomicrobia bacterium 61-8]|nr:hypothetical protein [Verrucomicrobiota bacterium]OJV18896.1 MAG: hypothetical protein BGO12_17710 [Verrucomicrobia bacterium 61-8]